MSRSIGETALGVLSIMMLAALGAGCGSESGTVDGREYDPVHARRVLTTALDAWKDGKARDLARLKPPIRFSDDDQKSGLRLVHHHFIEPDQPIQPYQGVPVDLTLRDASGTSRHRRVSYQITLEPGLSVLRDD